MYTFYSSALLICEVFKSRWPPSPNFLLFTVMLLRLFSAIKTKQITIVDTLKKIKREKTISGIFVVRGHD